jgi:N-acetylglucosamine kinase-like BadF-type ATPase
MRRAAVLAVDAGGSKSDAVVLRRDGVVLGAARVRSATVPAAAWKRWSRPGDPHLLMVGLAIERAAGEAGLDGHGPVAEVGAFCLAGADLPSDDRRLLRWIRDEGWTPTPLVRNDTFAVLRAGTDRAWGVAVVCGYGTNCTGVAPDGRTMRFPAIGPVSGDWGGGNELGGQAAWYAVRAEDGRGASTLLARLVPEHFGLRRPRQLMEAIYYDRIDEDRLAELAPVVFAAAAEDDAIARSIVDRQADEVVAMAGTAIRRLRMRRLDPDVVLGGGIFRTRFEPFYERIAEGLHAVAPAARIVRLQAPPVLGAAMLGLDAVEARRAAHTRARTALTHDRLTADTAHHSEEG